MTKFVKQQLSTTPPRAWSPKEIAMYGKTAELIVDTFNATGGNLDQDDWASFHAAVGSSHARYLKEGV